MFVWSVGSGAGEARARGVGALIRVGIVDDHPVFRLGLRRLFEQAEGLVVVWELASASELLATLAAQSVDVVLMDINLGLDQDGLAATRAVVGRSGAKVIVVSASLDMEAVAAAREAGASGFLPKDLPVTEMVEAVRAMVAQSKGSHAFADHLSQRAQDNGSSVPELGALTKREREVLAELRHGRTNREIAARLGVSIPTVNKHVQQVLKKLHVKSRAQAVASSLAAASGRAIGWDSRT